MKTVKIDDDKLDELGQVLSRRLIRQMSKRAKIEERWLEDLRQYHGRYSIDLEARLKKQEEDTGSSSIFVNITRSRTDTAKARLSDMLFPASDRNWDISPTPKPELVQRANSDKPVMGADGMPIAIDGQPLTERELAHVEMEQANEAAKGMRREIDDQLTEARYAAVARDVIQDAVQLGTGVVKGPIVVGRTRKAWIPVDGSTYELSISKERRPGLRRVSLWDFYPDMAASRVDDAEFFFERQRLTTKQARRLGKSDNGYILNRLKRVLEDDQHKKGVQGNTDIYARLREIADVYDSGGDDTCYELWIYTGPVDRDILDMIGIKRPGAFDELEVEVHFIGTTIIKIVEMPLETDEHGYSVFNWIKVDGSIFGYGMPYVLRDPQVVTNSSWRAMLDNGALSVGPVTVCDTRLIEPADGQWALTPRKVFWKKDPSASIGNAFATFNISSFQPELKDIFNTAKELADEEGAMPKIAQGEMGNTPIQTATATSMLMNASNSYLRDVVKNWDDDVTVPLIGRFYDYNMQFNPDPSIKGDFEVDARGASTLMVKETQTQALLSLMALANDPTFGPMTKAAALYRKTVEAQRLNPDDIVRSDEEIEQQQRAAQQQPNVEAQKLATEQQKLSLEQQRDEQAYELKMLELSLTHNQTMAQLQAKIQEVEMREQGESERQDREVAIKLATGSGL